MRFGTERRDRKNMMWGMILIGVGIVLLLGQLADAGVVPLRHWWPAIFFAIALARCYAPESPRQLAEGFGFALLGLWFFACSYHWYGLSYRKAWPLLLVIYGAEAVLTAVFTRLGAGQAVKEEHHA